MVQRSHLQVGGEALCLFQRERERERERERWVLKQNRNAPILLHTFFSADLSLSLSLSLNLIAQAHKCCCSRVSSVCLCVLNDCCCLRAFFVRQRWRRPPQIRQQEERTWLLQQEEVLRGIPPRRLATTVDRERVTTHPLHILLQLQLQYFCSPGNIQFLHKKSDQTICGNGLFSFLFKCRQHFYSEFLPRFIASSFCCSAHSIYTLDFFSSLHPSCLIFWWALLFSASCYHFAFSSERTLSGTVAERKGLGSGWTYEELFGHLKKHTLRNMCLSNWWCVCVCDRLEFITLWRILPQGEKSQRMKSRYILGEIQPWESSQTL